MKSPQIDGRFFLILGSLLSLTPAAAKRIESPRLDSLVTDGIRDLQATVIVEKADQQALRKINRDFGMTYRLKEVTLSYKDPDKVRMEGRIGLFVVNGPFRLIKVPQLGIKKSDNLGEANSRRYSLLDLGVVSRSALANTSAKNLRVETVDGVATYVFEVTYPSDPGVRNLVWVRAGNHAVVKREWYDAAGKLKATFLYLEPREIAPGVWFPTRVEIRNCEGNLAGVTAYEGVKVNQGLPDSLFDTNG